MKTSEAGTARRFGRTEAPRLGLADITAMLWTERALVITVGGAICALGLIAALVSPVSQPIMIVTLLTALLVSLAAGFSRALTRRSFATSSSAAGALDAPMGRPVLTPIAGGLERANV